MRWFIFSLVLFALTHVLGQMPSECLLVVNGSSADALRVANEYRALRGFPAERVLTLLPERGFYRRGEDDLPRWGVHESEARKVVLEPVLARLEALNDPSPTALIFSPDWPTRVQLDNGESVSLTAFVGFRGVMPEAEEIKYGRARGVWFTLPEELRLPGARLRRYPAPELREFGQHPAMMLGVLYEPLDAESIVLALRRSVAADFRRPVGSVAIITNTDVRTTARFHQFGPAAQRLESRGVPVFLADESAALPEKLIGLMMGQADIDTTRYAGALQAGAFAEHLTSHAATFDTRVQTKLTRWIAAGAAGSSGTITEPFAIWTKFPHAAIFERYHLGNTLLEALAQSVGHPYQQLFVGDALCRPWANRMEGLRLSYGWQGNTLRVEASGFPEGGGVDLHLFVDGRRVPGNGPVWERSFSAEEAGATMRVLLHARHAWMPPVLGRIEQEIKTPFSDSLRLRVHERGSETRVEVDADKPLVRWELLDGERVLHSAAAEGRRVRETLTEPPGGRGPRLLHARAITAAGAILVSSPVEVP